MNDSLRNDREHKVSVLIVDDQQPSRISNRLMCQLLFKNIADGDLYIREVGTIEEALDLLSESIFHIVLLDKNLGEDAAGKEINGVDLIPQLLSVQPLTQIIVLTGDDATVDIIRAMKMGASDYLMKGEDEENKAYREATIRNALQKAKHELTRARKERGDLGSRRIEFACKSPAMQRLYKKLECLAESNRPVLITGATGLGKGAAARELHRLRKKFLRQDNRPFFNLNISAIEGGVARSELFGHEAKSFTGSAEKAKIGFLELATTGDLFLDEIGDITEEVQVMLLKVIEEKEFQRLGGSTTIKTHTRFILATNKNLEELVKQGKFREDLYARISALVIQMPPLEERKEDLPDIVRILLEKECREDSGRKLAFEDLPQDLLDYLCRDNIPNNIRGIESEISRLVLFSPRDRNGDVNVKEWKKLMGEQAFRPRKLRLGGGDIELDHLLNLNTNVLNENFPGLEELKNILEKKVIEEALRKHPRLTEQAQALKMSKSFAHQKLRRFKLKERHGQP